MTTLRRQQYDVNGIVLNVWEAGSPDGTPIVFLHGFPEAGFAWQRQATFLADRGCRVLAPDQRGYNLSSRPKAVGDYRMDVLVQDIVALLGAAGIPRAILVGHDWGGGVAWHLAAQFPQLLSKLVILNMPHPQVMRRTLLQSNRQKLMSSYAGFFQLPLFPELAAGAFDFALLQRTLLRSSLPGTFSPEQLQQYKDAWRQPGALRGMINWYRAYRLSKPKLHSIDVPALVIWGKKDAFLLPQMAEASMDYCTKGSVILLEDATHWLHHEHPERISRLIDDFAQD